MYIESLAVLCAKYTRLFYYYYIYYLLVVNRRCGHHVVLQYSFNAINNLNIA